LGRAFYVSPDASNTRFIMDLLRPICIGDADSTFLGRERFHRSARSFGAPTLEAGVALIFHARRGDARYGLVSGPSCPTAIDSSAGAECARAHSRTARKVPAIALESVEPGHCQELGVTLARSARIVPHRDPSFIRSINDCRRIGQITTTLENQRAFRPAIVSPDH
jgi:hypothetical protein